MATALQSNATLTYVDLSRNSIGDVLMKKVSDSIELNDKNVGLRSLTLLQLLWKPVVETHDIAAA